MMSIQTVPLNVLVEDDQEVQSFSPAHSAIPVHRIVVHEIRNYLNVLIDGIAQLRTLSAIEALRSISCLENATQQISTLIPMLQVGTTVSQITSIDMVSLLWEQLALLESLFCVRSVSLEADIPDCPITVCGDGNQLGRALLNLIKNAVEACSANDTVSVFCRTETHHVTISICDTGVGMTPAQLTHLWQPLFTTKATGTGLGTCIARQIIINHGGSISADSVPETGTIIRIKLPLSNNQH